MSKISHPTFSSFLSFPVCINSSIFSAIFSPTPTYIIYKIKTKKYINKTCKYINKCCKSTFRGVREPSMCRGSKCFLSKRQIKLFRVHASNFLFQINRVDRMWKGNNNTIRMFHNVWLYQNSLTTSAYFDVYWLTKLIVPITIAESAASGTISDAPFKETDQHKKNHWKSLQLYWKSLHLYWKSLHLYWKSLHFYWKSLHLYWKSLHLYCKSLHLYWKSLHLYWKSLHLYWKSLHLYCKYLHLYWKSLHNAAWLEELMLESTVLLNKYTNNTYMYLRSLWFTMYISMVYNYQRYFILSGLFWYYIIHHTVLQNIFKIVTNPFASFPLLILVGCFPRTPAAFLYTLYLCICLLTFFS